MARDVDMRLPADEPEPWDGEPATECSVCGASDPRLCDEAKHAAVPNTYEMLARSAKVAKLVAVLREAHITADQVREFGKPEWMRTCIEAGLTVRQYPSVATVAAVIVELEK